MAAAEYRAALSKLEQEQVSTAPKASRIESLKQDLEKHRRELKWRGVSVVDGDDSGPGGGRGKRAVSAPSSRPNDPMAAATADDVRDPIISNNRDLRELSRECIEALARRNIPPRIFRRGTELVRIVEGTIEVLTEYRMRHELA